MSGFKVKSRRQQNGTQKGKSYRVSRAVIGKGENTMLKSMKTSKRADGDNWLVSLQKQHQDIWRNTWSQTQLLRLEGMHRAQVHDEGSESLLELTSPEGLISIFFANYNLKIITIKTILERKVSSSSLTVMKIDLHMIRSSSSICFLSYDWSAKMLRVGEWELV